MASTAVKAPGFKEDVGAAAESVDEAIVGGEGRLSWRTPALKHCHFMGDRPAIAYIGADGATRAELPRSWLPPPKGRDPLPRVDARAAVAARAAVMAPNSKRHLQVLDMKEVLEIKADAALCKRVKKKTRRGAALPPVPKFKAPPKTPVPPPLPPGFQLPEMLPPPPPLPLPPSLGSRPGFFTPLPFAAAPLTPFNGSMAALAKLATPSLGSLGDAGLDKLATPALGALGGLSPMITPLAGLESPAIGDMLRTPLLNNLAPHTPALQSLQTSQSL